MHFIGIGGSSLEVFAFTVVEELDGATRAGQRYLGGEAIASPSHKVSSRNLPPHFGTNADD